MISHPLMQLAMRAQLLTVAVCTTGAVSLSATATGYARAAGSFLTDGFQPGMELTASGFTTGANNGTKVIAAVSDLAITCAGCVVEASGTRTIAVGLPSQRAWENTDLAPVSGVPYLVEQYLPGPAVRDSIGPIARLTAEPQLVVQIAVPENTGRGAAAAYADAILAAFPPGLALTPLTNGDVLKVRGDTAPYRSQLVRSDPSYAVVTVSIPFRCHSLNSI